MCDWRMKKINKRAGGVRERSGEGKAATIFFKKTHRGVVDARHLHRQTWYQFTGGICDHSQFHRTASVILVNVPIHLPVCNISWCIMGAKDLVVRGPFSPAVNASMMGWPPARMLPPPAGSARVLPQTASQPRSFASMTWS